MNLLKNVFIFLFLTNNSHLTKENKIMNNYENYKPVFSWTYALWGVFGYFFHRKNVNKLPFWKSAGVDILVWGFLIGIVSKITAMFYVQSTVLDILHPIIFMAIWGFVGAWRFNKFKKINYDVELYKEREMIGIMSGIITYFIVFVIGLVVFCQAHYM